jgi:eukaryotic-like serine/threonine-protein kinase
MEFSKGRTWRSELQRLGSLSPSDMSGWIDQVLDGLAAAHEQGVIHRDLKPENLLLTGADEESIVKILDFGLAKVVADETTMTMTLPGEILGTYGYMSPEQLSGRSVDERTDLFAVGVIVFEMLTGYRPFRGASLPDLVRSVFEDDLHLPEKVNSSAASNPSCNGIWPRTPLNACDRPKLYVRNSCRIFETVQ